MSWFNRLSNLLHREDLGRELDEELQFHIDARIRDNLNAGMTAEAAQLDARRRFGNWSLAKEKTVPCRDSTERYQLRPGGVMQAYRLTGQSFLIFCPPRCSGVGDRRPAGVGRDAGGGARSCRRRTAVGTFPEGAAWPRVPDELRGDRRWR